MATLKIVLWLYFEHVPTKNLGISILKHPESNRSADQVRKMDTLLNCKLYSSLLQCYGCVQFKNGVDLLEVVSLRRQSIKPFSQ